MKYCEILITHHFGVDSRDYSGNLQVQIAARVGDSLIMKQLIENNAAIINATNYSNQAPLHLAAKSGHEEVFHILKIFDANDFKDNGGKTAEDYAHEQGHRDKFNIEYLALYS